MTEFESYQNLANAIVAQAAEDYLKALHTLKECMQQRGGRNNGEGRRRRSTRGKSTAKNEKEKLDRREIMADDEKSTIERFFRSQWYTQLTEVAPDALIKDLQKEAEWSEDAYATYYIKQAKKRVKSLRAKAERLLAEYKKLIKEAERLERSVKSKEKAVDEKEERVKTEKNQHKHKQGGTR